MDGVRLLERERHLDAITDLLVRAASGTGGTLVLIGAAGHGKTALLTAGADLAPETMTVRHARGRVGEREFPFAVAEQLCGPLAVAEDGDPRSHKLVALSRFRSAIEKYAADGSLLLILDDAQWADADSLTLVGYLARRVRDLPVAIVIASRPECDRVLDIAREPHTDLLEVPALGEPASRDLLAQLVPRDVDDELRSRAWRLAGGNPMLIEHVAATVRGRDEIPSGADEAMTGLRHALLLSRIAGLGGDGIRCARAIAVLGGDVRLAPVQAVAQLDDDAFAIACDTLAMAGVLRALDHEHAELRDDLLAAAIVADTDAGERRLLHRRAFDHHYARGEVTAAAVHALPGGMYADQHAVAALTAAAGKALVDGAVQTALAHIRTATTLAGERPSLELLVKRARILFAAGHASEAVDAFTAAARADPSARTELLVGAARAQAYAGRFEDAAASYADLVAEAGGPDAAPAGLLLERAHVAWELGGPRGGLDALAPNSSDPLMRSVRTVFQLQAGDPSGVDELRRLAHAARNSVAREAGDPFASFNLYQLHITACAYLERFDEAAEFVAHATDWLTTSGVPTGTSALRFTLAGTLLRRGELARAMAELDRLDEDAVVDEVLRPGVDLYRARVLLLMGRPADVPRLRERAGRSPAAAGWFMRLTSELVAAECLLAAGDPSGAWDVCGRIAAEARRIELREPCIVPWRSVAIDAALGCGHIAELENLIDELERDAADLPCTWPRLVALGGRAALAAKHGTDAAAVTLYDQALALPAVVPLERARIALRYGRWLRRRGDLTRARSVLASVIADAERLGAAGIADASTAELSAANGRRRRRVPDALTTQERRVAELAAGGATMREIATALFVSPRTVETHLTHVYAKLGVSGKHELRRRRADLGLA